jgi:Tol biopolymer transport system component
VAAAGGTPVAVTREDAPGMTDRVPWFLPDGKRLLYFSGSPTSDKEKTSAIRVLDLDSGKSSPVAREDSEGRWVEPGYLLFVRDGNLMAQPMDGSSLKTTGEAVPIAERIHFNPARWAGNFTASNTGRLVFQGEGWGRKEQLTWFELDGKELGKVGEPASFISVSVSPDSTRAAATLATTTQGASNWEVWLYDLQRGVATRFSFAGQGDYFPQWSPDGRRIAYALSAGGLVVKDADGTTEPKTLWAAKTNTWPLSWSPDGKYLVFRLQDPKSGGIDLWLLPMDGSGKARPLIATPASESLGEISPDGKWLLYSSNESGRREIYVVPFPGLGEKRQISTSGADGGWWLGNNRIAFVQPPDDKLFVVDVETRGSSFLVGAARPAFGGRPLPRGPLSPAADGKRLLIAVPTDENASPQVRLVSNWPAELKKK